MKYKRIIDPVGYYSDKPKDLGLRLDAESDRHYFHLNAGPVWITAAGAVINVSEDALADFLITCQGGSIGDNPAHLYGFEVCFQSPYRVGLQRARAMVKTLETVDKRLTALTKALGPVGVDDYPGYVARVALCLGISWWVWEANPKDRISLCYSERDWRITTDTTAAVYRMQALTEEWREGQTKARDGAA